MEAQTAALVMTYQMPTANLDTSNIDQVRSDAQARLDELHLDWLPDLLSDALARVRTRLDAAGLPDDPTTTPDPRKGQLTAVVTVTGPAPSSARSPSEKATAANFAVQYGSRCGTLTFPPTDVTFTIRP